MAPAGSDDGVGRELGIHSDGVQRGGGFGSAAALGYRGNRGNRLIHDPYPVRVTGIVSPRSPKAAVGSARAYNGAEACDRNALKIKGDPKENNSNIGCDHD